MPNAVEVELHKAMGDFYHDPLGWVIFAFPWDTDPDLQIVELKEPWSSRFNSKYGPDTWFCKMCDDWQAHMQKHPFDGKTAVPPFKDATASGHGIGKSAASALIELYIMSTRPFSKGVVTSNTSDQLRTKTWGELAKWKNKCITGHWFTLNNGKGNMNLFHNKHKETWRIDAITCREENSESFAGLHCANSSPWYLFDEACHDDQTEVMTDTGWKLFKDVTKKDKLLTMDIANQTQYFDYPTNMHVSHFDGEMIAVDSNSLNFCVTPSHRMLFVSKSSPPSFELAGESNWIGKRVLVGNGFIEFTKSNLPRKSRYSGKVYCATVSGGVLFTRRGGNAIWSGNSAVPDKIWEVAEGGTTDGEPFWFVFGNPTRNSGRFRECWRRFRTSWNKRKVDSRSVQVTNKKLLDRWKQEYGEDSDFYKVRVRGDFPSASSNQKIPGDLLDNAMDKESPHLAGDPKVMSLDVARGGSDNCVINFRQGLNGKIRAPITLPGTEYRDSMRLAAKMVEAITDFQPDMTFVDATGVGGPVADRIRQLGFDCIDVNFASKSPDSHFANMRAYMAHKWLEWLKDGGSVTTSEDLKTEVGAVEFTHNGRDQEILIPKDMIKKKIGVSTDEFDSYILLHAMPVAPKHRSVGKGNAPASTMGYNPWRDSEMIADTTYDPFDD